MNSGPPPREPPPVCWEYVEQLCRAHSRLETYSYPDSYDERINLFRSGQADSWRSNFNVRLRSYFEAAAIFRHAEVDRIALVRHVMHHYIYEQYIKYYEPVFQELNSSEAIALLPDIIDRMLEEENLNSPAVNHLLGFLSPEVVQPLLLSRFEAYLTTYLARYEHLAWEGLGLEFWWIFRTPMFAVNRATFLEVLDGLLGPGSGARLLAEWEAN